MPGYETMIPLAVENPRVVVARTFSKCFGMAGIRIGYAIGHKDTIAKMGDWDGDGDINVIGLSAARRRYAVPDAWVKDESKRNDRRRARSREVVHGSRLRADRFADQLPVRRHQAAGPRLPRSLPKEGMLVGRDFPPYEKTHCRISVGTMEEMQKAVKVFERRWHSRPRRPPLGSIEHTLGRGPAGCGRVHWPRSDTGSPVCVSGQSKPGFRFRRPGGPMEIDRRAFIASVGGRRWSKRWIAEAKAEALEHYMRDVLDEEHAGG